MIINCRFVLDKYVETRYNEKEVLYMYRRIEQ